MSTPPAATTTPPAVEFGKALLTTAAARSTAPPNPAKITPAAPDEAPATSTLELIASVAPLSACRTPLSAITWPPVSRVSVTSAPVAVTVPELTKVRSSKPKLASPI